MPLVLKTDQNENVLWTRKGGGDYGYGIAKLNSQLFVTGLFNGTVNFGTTALTSNNSNDIYTAALDAETGNITAALRAGGLGNDAERALAANAPDCIRPAILSTQLLRSFLSQLLLRARTT